jgi:hypothetical protein
MLDRLPVRSSSLKERAGVKGVLGLRFCVRAPFAGRAELTPWLLSPRRCPISCERGRLGQGPGRRPGRAAAPEASLTRVPASR